MTKIRAGLVGGLAISVAFVVGIALGAPALQAQRPAEPSPSTRLWGRVTSLDGRVDEGWLRIGGRVAAWGDRLPGRLAAGGIARAAADGDASLAQQLDRARAEGLRVLDVAGRSIGWVPEDGTWDRDRVRIPLHQVREMRQADAGGWVVTLADGLELGFEVDGEILSPGERDGGLVHVVAADGQASQVPLESVVRLEFGRSEAPETALARPAGRLRARVTDRRGRTWSGRLTLGRRGLLTTDTLPVADDESPVRLADLRWLEASRGGRIEVETRAGERRRLRGTDAAVRGDLAVIVGDDALGEVRLPWAMLERIEWLEPGGSSPTEVDRAMLRGDTVAGLPVARVQAIDGGDLTGALIWDADEARAWQLVEGWQGGVRFGVALAALARVEPIAERGARLTLRDGRTLELFEHADVDRRNAGLLVRATDGAGDGWQRVAWGGVRSVHFEGGDRPATPATPARAEPATTTESHPLRAEAFADSATRALFNSARERRQSARSEVLRYTAEVRQRIAASLRTPLRDRRLFGSELAARVFWSRDHEPVVQMLGARTRTPVSDDPAQAGTEPDDPLSDVGLIEPFDPGGERLFFGFVDTAAESDVVLPGEDFWIAHPLGMGADTLYDYRGGDTLTVSLPDGRSFRAVQLEVSPRFADAHRVRATLWIEPERGDVVRAAYRLADRFDAIREIDGLADDPDLRWVPGLLKPLTFDLDLMVIDYSLWELDLWMPRALRFEGRVAAGVLKVPVSFDVNYRIEHVTRSGAPDRAVQVAESQAAALRQVARALSEAPGAMPYRVYGASDGDEDGESESGAGGVDDARAGRYLVPEDPGLLRMYADLPPPLGEDGEGFIDDETADELRGLVLTGPGGGPRSPQWSFTWGPGGADLLRYNRIEGLGVGARVAVRTPSPMGPLAATLTGFLGTADLDAKVRLDVERPLGTRTLTVSLSHELRVANADERPLGAGASLNALLFGRDDGQYFTASGAAVRLSPAGGARADRQLRLYAERHRSAQAETRFALGPWLRGNDAFSANLGADPVDEFGADLLWRVGGDPGSQRAFSMLELMAGTAVVRTRDHGVTVPGEPTGPEGGMARVRVTARTVRSLSERWQLGLEGAVGQGWGAVSRQRQWFVGGVRSLRGYPGGLASGRALVRARAELARGFTAARWSLFADAGWVGDQLEPRLDETLWSAGVGASLLDGLVRLDLAKGFRGPQAGWRLDLHLDGLL